MTDRTPTLPGVVFLLLALITTALLAGLYYSYAVSVMLALGKLDDRTFVDVMNKVNIVILNPVFLLSFLGSIGFSIGSALFFLRADLRPVLIWVAVGIALNVLSLLVTAIFHVPLNRDIAVANNSTGPIDYAALREACETPWVTWNIVRALLNTGAVGALGWALVQYGRLRG